MQAGKLKLLAVATTKRSPAVPDVPTVAASTGIANFDFTLWAVYGRCPRCKSKSDLSAKRSGAAMYPACFRIEACPVAMRPLWPLALM
jgi:hypothetical protein